jgi:hypothetical protein
MSLVEHIKAAFLAVAADIKQLKAQVALAGGAWPLVSEDPVNPLEGYPWLLQTELVGAVPAGVRVAGFGRITVINQAPVESTTLSVKTSTGQIARFAATALE